MSLSKDAWATWPTEPFAAARDAEVMPVVGLYEAATERVCVLDTETTGLMADARIVEISAAWVNLRTGDIEREAVQLVNPGVPIPPMASSIHGITDRQVARKPPLAEVLPRVITFLGEGPLVAHNARFDVKRIRFEADRCRVLLPGKIPVWCTMKLAKKAFPGQGSYRLDALAQSLSLRPTGRAHRARADVQTTCQLVVRCITEARQDLREILKPEDTL